MATLKACVQKKRKDGMYIVYIRVTQQRKIAYIKTSWLVNDKGLSKDKKDIKDPFVIEQTSKLIETYYDCLNKVDTLSWTIQEVVEYIQRGSADVCFSDYAKEFIGRMIEEERVRTAKNYSLAVKSLELYAQTNNLMFSRLTSSFLVNWIDSMKDSARKKEQYPVCVREIWKSAQREYNVTCKFSPNNFS